MKLLAAILLILGALTVAQGQWAVQPGPVPAYHEAPPAKGETLAAVLTEKQLADQGFTSPEQKAAYRAAAKIPTVLYQLPCYCFCDRNHGHTSLHSCYESAHAVNCSICLTESLYAYRMSKKGWTAKMIREGILRGEYKEIDLKNPDPVP